MLALCSDSAEKSREDILLAFVYLFFQDNGNKLPRKCKHLPADHISYSHDLDLLCPNYILEMTVIEITVCEF